MKLIGYIEVKVDVNINKAKKDDSSVKRKMASQSKSLMNITIIS